MEKIYVESSNIQSVMYDPDNAILEVEFKQKGAVYQYFDVPQYEYDELMNAESKGKYINLHIKKYRCQRIG